jgi:LysM repeat protein
MKRPASYKIVILCLAGLLLTMGLATTGAQEQNLLTNPGFEGSFRIVSGQPDRRVAQGWNPWHVPATAGMRAYENAQPEYDQVAPNTARIRSGSNAQMYFNTFYTHTGGIFQRVTGITPGTELRFSIYIHVWSSTLENTSVSESPGDVLVDVGIDPTGGTDGTSNNIVWSVPVAQYDAYREYSVIATSTSSAVTVFVRSRVGFPVQNTYIYLDDAVLALTTPTVIVTDTPVPQPTDTPVPVDTNTPVPDAPDTPVPTQTPLPTITEDPTPTREVDDSVIIPVPIETATPTSMAAPTEVAIGGPFSPTFPGTLTHTVRSGDTVGRLAVLYGSTIEAIIEANNLNPNALIFVNQPLMIPVPLAAPATSTPTVTPEIIAEVPAAPDFGTGGVSGITYIVRPGDTLFRIAIQHNTTTNALAAANGIADINLIRAGQQLIIPGVAAPPPPSAPLPPPATYMVRAGDNLYRISLRFGVPMQRLSEANNIINPNLIFAGQILIIP